MTVPPSPAAADTRANPPQPSRGVRADDRHDRFVTHLLTLRGQPGTRAALRRGDSPALQDRAAVYLAPWNLSERDLPAALLFAAALARFPAIRPDRATTFAGAARRTLGPEDRLHPEQTGVGRRIIAVQRQSLPMAHRNVTALLRAIDERPGLGLDWVGLWRSYRRWDDPDPQRRRATRLRLLTDFYALRDDTPPGAHTATATGTHPSSAPTPTSAED